MLSNMRDLSNRSLDDIYHEKDLDISMDKRCL